MCSVLKAKNNDDEYLIIDLEDVKPYGYDENNIVKINKDEIPKDCDNIPTSVD